MKIQILKDILYESNEIFIFESRTSLYYETLSSHIINSFIKIEKNFVISVIWWYIYRHGKGVSYENNICFWTS